MTLDEFRRRRSEFTRVVGVSPVETEEAITEQVAQIVAGLEVDLIWAADEDGAA